MKRIRNLFASVTCFTLALLCLVPVGNASQANPPAVSDVLVSKPIYSSMSTESNTYTLSAKSLWYNDPTYPTVKHVIKTYDHHGTIKHSRDGVEITVRRVGQINADNYTMINGKRVPLTCSYEIVSSYPYQFIEDSTYTIDRKYVPEGETCTIFTAGYLSLNNNRYTRYEVNVYIYWDDIDSSTGAPSVSMEYVPVMDCDPSGAGL